VVGIAASHPGECTTSLWGSLQVKQAWQAQGEPGAGGGRRWRPPTAASWLKLALRVALRMLVMMAAASAMLLDVMRDVTCSCAAPAASCRRTERRVARSCSQASAGRAGPGLPPLPRCGPSCPSCSALRPSRALPPPMLLLLAPTLSTSSGPSPT
jgi:hypothetical protein